MKSKTIAQQLNVSKFPFEIKDNNGNKIYSEDSYGFWSKWEYDSNNNLIYYETSYGFWSKWEYDSNNNLIYYETSDGFWYKCEYDSNGNEIYYEDSNGYIEDNRPKITIPNCCLKTVELTLDEIASKFGIPVSQLKIKK